LPDLFLPPSQSNLTLPTLISSIPTQLPLRFQLHRRNGRDPRSPSRWVGSLPSANRHPECATSAEHANPRNQRKCHPKHRRSKRSSLPITRHHPPRCCAGARANSRRTSTSEKEARASVSRVSIALQPCIPRPNLTDTVQVLDVADRRDCSGPGRQHN
jgi:hypothetical protein